MRNGYETTTGSSKYTENDGHILPEDGFSTKQVADDRQRIPGPERGRSGTSNPVLRTIYPPRRTERSSLAELSVRLSGSDCKNSIGQCVLKPTRIPDALSIREEVDFLFRSTPEDVSTHCREGALR